VRPLPPRPPLPALLRWPGLALAAALAVSWRLAEGDLGALLSSDGRRALAGFAAGFWPPERSPEFLRFLVRPLLDTVAIAFLGLALAVVLAAPLAYLATEPARIGSAGFAPSLPRRVAWGASRALLNLMRSIPELVWALVFVRAVGLGPAAGVLALGVGYAGILGKVFAEILEGAPRAPADTLAALGAPPRRAFAFATLPQALPMLASYTLYRFDCALRASAVLGLVGAGGIGVQLELSLRMLAHGEVATMVLALFALVAAVDLASRVARRRLHRLGGPFPVGRAALAARLALAAAALAAAAGAAAWLELPVGEMLSPRAIVSAGAFLASGLPPDADPAFLAKVGSAALVTLGVSVLGTAIAAGAGLLLAWPVALRHHALGTGVPARWPRRAALAAASAAARAVMNLGRTLPELLWALLLIFAVGLGPFAGALALAIHTAGVLGRLYAEALEETPAGAFAALRAGGAGSVGASLLGLLPQAAPQLVAYTLYRWEVNIRASAVLGVVGAGGLGGLLHVSLNLFQHHRTATLVLLIVLLVTAVDLASGALRRRALEGPEPDRRSAPPLAVAVDAT
jgi:phosphonate transport system permease protein